MSEGALKMKIDVCLVTKNNIETIKGLEHVPVNKLIVETSTPLGLARRRAIQKVTTPVFAFIDDDAEIDEMWFQTLLPHIQDPSVGAVQGILSKRGMGVKWDAALKKPNDPPRSLKLGERGFTHNTLMKTDLVKDWMPPEDLSAWEDYDLTRHILKKGYSWMKVSTESGHRGSWKRSWRNSQWGIAGRKRYYPSRRDSFVQIFRKAIWIVRVMFSLKMNWREKVFRSYFSIATIWAHMRWLYTSAGM